ncbi:MAG: hypothetical protein ACUVTP_09480, partial [Candidatus Fervidibacter sp.]|uniref:hypothetical protein n=1 Tax=Candidatus Fervidibacter sp. TaxID=3100871 RepID=UPI00404AAF69
MGWLTLPNVYLTLFFTGLGITALMLVLGLAHDFVGSMMGTMSPVEMSRVDMKAALTTTPPLTTA